MILGGNPAYTAPADLEFAQAVRKVRAPIHLGLYEDETSALCRWHVPEAHELEILGRRPGLRRHGDDRPAADRAALRRRSPRTSSIAAAARRHAGRSG